MNNITQHTGFAIAIAWPETYCKQPGSWYDGITNFLGFSDNNYYKVGHAALVLIDSKNKKCHYFDFGRYHAPFLQGRVRSTKTDHGLEIKTIPKISNNSRKIENFNNILTELQLNAECHGEGKLHASYCSVNFQKSFVKAKNMQKTSPIAYGPFEYKGSNCSRFVNTVILAGKPKQSYAFKLKYFVPLTPTPLNNVNSLNNKVILEKMLTKEAFCPTKILDKEILKTTLIEPLRYFNIPETAQWLSGEGAGSWFNLELEDKEYKISRFNQAGEFECEGIFEKSKDKDFNNNLPFEFVHLSHCNKVRLKQNNKIIEFNRVEKEIKSVKTEKKLKNSMIFC